MSDEDRYRRYAKFCREQASLLSGPERERWIHLAEEYERLAQQPQPKPEDDEK